MPFTILVVDDSKFSRGRILAALQSLGHVVVEAADGQEALDLVETLAPDLIITDLLMPNVDGFGLLRGLRDRRIHVPIIVVSADIQSSSRQMCEELGVLAFLNKPFAPLDLVAKTQAALWGAILVG
jgi:CheY-like chemotaxis protein